MPSTFAIDQLDERLEVLEAHDASSASSDFAHYRGRPVESWRAELGFEPYAKQIEVAEAFVMDRRIAVPGAVGVGKEKVLAGLLLYAAYVLGMLCIAISATKSQVLTQLWREVRALFSRRLPGELLTSELRIGGETRILARTSNAISNLTGYHDPKGVFVAISESQSESVEDAAFDAALSNTIDDASRIVVVGNPIKSSGRFYEVSTRGTWRVIPISVFDHPNVIEQRVVIAGGPAPSYPDEMAREVGPDSPFYIARVLGQFPPTGSVDALVEPAWLAGAYARHAEPYGMRLDPKPVVALDVARSLARDESVASLAQDARLVAQHAWRSRDLVDTATRLLEVVDGARLRWYAEAAALHPDNVVAPTDREHLSTALTAAGVPQLRVLIDTPGIGSGVVDDCRRRHRIVEEYWGWVPANDEKRFRNRRSEVFWTLRTLLQDGRAALPFHALLDEECRAMQWSQDEKGRIVMVSKEDLRATLKRSPDRLDSAAMALWAASGQGQRRAGYFRPLY